MRKIKEPQPEAPVVPPPPESSVADLSGKLNSASEKADKADRVLAARAAVFESANAVKEVPQSEVMRKIVSFQMGDDTDAASIVRDMRDLESELDSTNKQGFQVNALEHVESQARRAFKLLIRYRELHQAWEMDNSVIFGSMWGEAAKALQREKDQGYRSKQITDKDVEAMVSTMFPDEWRSQEVKRLRAKQTEKSLEHLVEMWSSKCRSLGLLVGKGR